ncbi:hypothetical protein [Prescottella subtropica]|uniref:hypothetical protein n=1 Tax=Prescottella subtropica TaxID=2545757 RepID=UPI0010F79F86|nr:hypothetical protein [Prescottella subtropica]
MSLSRAGTAFGVAATAVAVVAGATACDSTPRYQGEQPARITGDAPSTVAVHTVTFKDGAKVRCIWEADSSQGGGLSCDWASATSPTPAAQP